MNPSPIDSTHDGLQTLLKDLEQRHNDVLLQLDDLNRRVEQALTDARRQFAPDALPLATAKAD